MILKKIFLKFGNHKRTIKSRPNSNALLTKKTHNMSPESSSKRLLEVQLAQAKDTLSAAEILIQNKKWNSAVNRIYFAMYHHLRALCAKYDFTPQNDEQAFEWFKYEFIDKKLCDKKYLHTIRDTFEEHVKVDYDTLTDFDEEEVKELSELMNDFIQKINDFIELSPTLINDTIILLKDNSFLLKKGKISPKGKKAYEDLKKFLNEELFKDNTKAQKNLKDFIEDPTNQRLAGNLEVRLEDQLEDGNPLLPVWDEKLFALKLSTPGNIETPDIKEQKQQVTVSEQPKEKKAVEPKTETKTEQPKPKPKPKPGTKEKPAILVPYDFTQVADFAIEHAVQFAEISGGEITLANIVKRSKEIDQTQQKLQAIAQKTFNKHKIKPLVMIREGNIFTEISQIAADINAKLAIMGTHGITGMQKLTGSKALKVIAGTDAPFVVVQAPPKRDKIQTVLFPVDARRETKQKLNQARFLTKYYDIKFILSHGTEYSSKTLKQRFTNNLKFTRGYLKQLGAEYEILSIEGISDPVEATIEAAQKVQPDLLLIVTTKDIGFQDYVLGADEQKIIANNAKIPVMCVNPIRAKSYSYSSSGS